MKTEQILDMDCRTKEGMGVIQSALHKIPILDKKHYGEEIPLESIEKVIESISRKYCVEIQYITPSYREETVIYSASLKDTKAQKEFKWIGNVYGCCIYEIMAKALIKMYSDVKKGLISMKGGE